MKPEAIATTSTGVSGVVDPVVAALCAVAALTTLGLPLLIRELAAANDRSIDVVTVLRRLRDEASGLDLLMTFWWLAFLIAGAAWIHWQGSTHAHLSQAHVRGLPGPPWRSVFVWFVPIVALVWPGFIVGRLLRGAKAGPEGDARSVEPALVVWFWWLLFACGWLSFTLGVFIRLGALSFVGRENTSPVSSTGNIVGNFRTADVLLLIGSVLLLAAAPLAVVVHAQVDRARRRTTVSWAPPRPDLNDPSPLD
jgi:hypothetical protein